MNRKYNMNGDAPLTNGQHHHHHVATHQQTIEQLYSSQEPSLSPSFNGSTPQSTQRHPNAAVKCSQKPSHKPNRLINETFTNPNGDHRITQPSKEEVKRLFQRCRDDDWHSVLQTVQENPYIALEPMTMDNHISTTIVHQAITSKDDTTIRAKVISTILSATPEAAAMKNGYGSMPLHVIAQRNVKMDAQTKERLIFELVQSFKEALTHPGGVGGRTPLHIIFTDYISPRLTKMMIENGADACFMKDKKGFLPAHVACMRHCSPEKLRMLLSVNPGALHARTDENQTLLDLASKKATKAHPNYALIDELQKQLAGDVSHYDPVLFTTPPQISKNIEQGHHSDDKTRNDPAIVSVTSHQYNPQYSTTYPLYHHASGMNGQGYHYSSPLSQQPFQRQYQSLPQSLGSHPMHDQHYEYHRQNSIVGRVSSEDEDTDTWNRSHFSSNETWETPIGHQQAPSYPPPYRFHPLYYRRDVNAREGTVANNIGYGNGVYYSPNRTPSNRHPTYESVVHGSHPTHPMSSITPSKKRKSKSSSRRVATTSEEPAAKLLLHFSRNSNGDDNVMTSVNEHIANDMSDHPRGEKCIASSSNANRFNSEYPDTPDTHRGTKRSKIVYSSNELSSTVFDSSNVTNRIEEV